MTNPYLLRASRDWVGLLCGALLFFVWFMA